MNNNIGIVFDVGKAHEELILFHYGVVGGGRGTLCVCLGVRIGTLNEGKACTD